MSTRRGARRARSGAHQGRLERCLPAGAQPARRPIPGALVLAAGALAGSVPFSGIAARLLAGVDLRQEGEGTVSGTGLYRVTGFGPLAVAGSLDVLKGAVGPALAGVDRPVLAALAGGGAVLAHNWSPWLRGAGGRGISPAIGALAVVAPEGSAVLLGGLAAGRLLRQTGLGALVSFLALVPLLARRRGRAGFLAACCVVVPAVTKRLIGNRQRHAALTPEVVVARLLFDRDTLRPA